MSYEEVLIYVGLFIQLHRSQTAAAREIGCSPQHLHNLMHKGFFPQRKVLEFFGLRKVPYYVAAEQ